MPTFFYAGFLGGLPQDLGNRKRAVPAAAFSKSTDGGGHLDRTVTHNPGLPKGVHGQYRA